MSPEEAPATDAVGARVDAELTRGKVVRNECTWT